MDKPFLTFEQQIKRLTEDYKLIINDSAFAIEALSSISYYDLVNGYKSIYMTNGTYKSGTTIEMLYNTHIYNKNIQGVLIKYATFVENSFKTSLSHIIAGNISEDHNEYLKINHYRRHRNSSQRAHLSKTIYKLVSNCSSDNNPTKHYSETKNHIPPWILFRNTTFSNVTDLYNNLIREHKNLFLSQIVVLNNSSLSYEDKTNVYLTSLKVVRKFRNKIAHNLDFITYRNAYLGIPAFNLFSDTLITESEMRSNRNNVWTFVLSIVITLNNKYLIHNFLVELNSYLDSDESIADIYCNSTGIPLDYKQRIIDYIALTL